MKASKLRVGLGVLGGLLLLIWFLWDVRWADLAAVLMEVRLEWVVASAAMMMLEWTFRGARWWVFLRHVDKDLRLWTCISATWAGVGLNSVLPLRGGDLVRPALVAADRGLPFSLTFSTTLLERLFDWGAVCAMLASMLATFPSDVVDHSETLVQLRWWSGVFSVLGVLTILGAFALLNSRVRAAVLAGAQRLPEGIRAGTVRQLEQILLGVTTAGDLRRFVMGLVLTAGVWITGVLSALYLFYAMNLPLGVGAAVFVVGALSLSVALPQAPGYLGVFQVAMEEALKLFQAPVSVAQTAALLFWAICYLPVTLVGLTLAWQRRHQWSST